MRRLSEPVYGWYVVGLFYCVFQALPRFKYRNLLCGDLDGCARLGVSALAGFSLAHPKGTKSHQRYRITFFECFLDCRKCCA